MFGRKKDVETEERPKPKGPVIRSSYVWAGVIAVLILGWMLSGQIEQAELADNQAAADGVSDDSQVLRRVQGIESVAEDYQRELTIRGRTSSLRTVAVRSETSGRVVEMPVEKGMLVKTGDVLCRLDVEARAAQLEEAKALAAQRRLEWKASEKLLKQGHRSKTQNAASKAAYESSLAYLKQMQIGLARTEIKAPFDGLFNDRMVEVGDYMQPGQVCGSVVDQDPFLVVAQVSEEEVGFLQPKAGGRATLVTGQEVSGHIRYVSASANEATRTFLVELEINEFEGVLRDGITADIAFPLQSVLAHKISPAILSLDAKGLVGIRTVDDAGKVAFSHVEIVADTGDGVYVTGLPERTTIITRGQELVSPGQEVEVVFPSPNAS